MNKITYNIIDSLGNHYEGEFYTVFKEPREITIKLKQRHPKISLPFKETNVKVTKK